MEAEAAAPSRSEATLTLNAQRARTADRILEQFKGEDFSDGEIPEASPVAHVAPVKEDVAAIAKADEAVSLPQHQVYDPA